MSSSFVLPSLFLPFHLLTLHLFFVNESLQILVANLRALWDLRANTDNHTLQILSGDLEAALLSHQLAEQGFKGLTYRSP